ncbi:uncharacterized protein LOC126184465 [Schistocerca cancellata]|uniref:uncharacterized protein LOC126184465 n=1 Tax=Schistocerca cancellata TaxID=274614 RepID=UPI002117CC3A|nr:uncharacterized protein LOC126184465 [Schistocerca cancellata]
MTHFTDSLVRKTSKRHLQNKESFQLLGKSRIEHALSEAARLTAIKYNEQVAPSRRVLARFIQAIVFLCKQELAFRGYREDEYSSNKGKNLELLDLLAQGEQLIRDHLSSSSTFKGTSPDIQNDVIEMITLAVNKKIRSEIQNCNFISIQADATLDASWKRQMTIIFRYCIADKIEVIFVGFYYVSGDKTAEGMSNIIYAVFKEWNVEGKVVSQTYDGASVMAGRERGLQQLVKKSSKRTVLLTETGFKLPHASNARWNFRSRAFSTSSHFSGIYSVFNYIFDDTDSQWDP